MIELLRDDNLTVKTDCITVGSFIMEAIRLFNDNYDEIHFTIDNSSLIVDCQSGITFTIKDDTEIATVTGYSLTPICGKSRLILFIETEEEG